MSKYKTLQVLVATMNQEDFCLYNKMNLDSDAIIANQRKGDIEIKKTQINNNEVIWLNFDEHGVGLNRNNALMRSTADIVVFADDDMIFYDGYKEKVLEEFNDNPKADVLIFNIDEDNKKRISFSKRKYTKKCGFGTVRIACKRKSLFKYGITFNLIFGGGTEHGYGEDSLFLMSCKKNGLKALTVPYSIAKLQEERESTWFHGFDEKYFTDNGYLLGAMDLKVPYIHAIKNALDTKSEIVPSVYKRLKLILGGIWKYKHEKF